MDGARYIRQIQLLHSPVLEVISQSPMQETEIVLPPELAEDPAQQERVLRQTLSLVGPRIYFRIKRSSLDARKKPPVFRLLLEWDLEPLPEKSFEILRPVLKKEVIIVGAGPAGLFAALKCLELGLKPIILERGKAVRERRRDLAQITRNLTVNPESNYCFGEGGAGTYSDGKLYTRSGKRGNIERILNLFVHFGADPRILYEAHPHIGTNKLPGIIEHMRNDILERGGEVHFNTKVTGFILEGDAMKGVICASGEEFRADALILATGHSARDIFELLYQKNIYIESKPFALGVRIEHPQQVIDAQQYRCEVRGPHLPPATYSLVEQVKGRGVFSFCMCPGGIIAPAATAPGEVVVNGWSPSKRNNPFANSGFVVSVDDTDFIPFEKAGPLKAMFYQQAVEQKCFEMAHQSIQAPAQRITDFIHRKSSASLPENSYLPGLTPLDLELVLPKAVSERLRLGLSAIGKKMRGFVSEEGIMVATESRTSSPVRIPRDRETGMHIQVQGFFPCGEGAGYAGGIVSAAMDGEKMAHSVHSFLKISP